MSVFDLEKLAQLVTSRMGSLLVEHQRCSRIRSPLSKCSLCLDICPRDVLEFGEAGIEIGDACLECGLCAGVCPTGALELQEPTEIALLNRIRSLGGEGGTIAIGCHREKELNPRGFSVPCLGSLSLEFLMVIEQLSFPVYLIMDQEQCSQCPVVGGGDYCRERLNKSRQLLDKLGLNGGAVNVLSQAPTIKVPRRKKTEASDRRAFFRSVFSGARQVPRAMLQSVLLEETGTAEETTSIQAMPGVETSRLTLLKEALTLLKESSQPLEFLHIPALTSTCHFCRACAILCPLGALECTDDYQLILDGGRCTGCDLCLHICLHKSLSPIPNTISQLCQGEKILIAQGTKSRCTSCGQEMIVSEAREQCFICEKKDSWQAI